MRPSPPSDRLRPKTRPSALRALALVLLAGTAAADGGDAAVPLDSFNGWSVECHNGWRAGGEALLRCNGPSNGEVKSARGPSGPAVELDWDLGSSDWVQSRYAFPAPADLSGLGTLRLALRGASSAGAAVQVNVLLADADDVFYGAELFNPSEGLQLADRWQARFSLPKSAFTYRFNTRGNPPSAIDWSRITRFYLAVVRPCAQKKGGEEWDCFGGGRGKVFLDGWKTDANAPASAGLEWVSLWKDEAPAAGPLLWDEETAPLGAAAAALAGAGAPGRWSAECDGGAWPQADPLKCRGAAASALAPLEKAPAPGRRLSWDMRETGEWVQARYAFGAPSDLSGAEALGFSLEGSGRPGAAHAIGIMLSDANDVFYTYDLDLSHIGFKGPWRLHLSLAKESFYYHFNTHGGGPRLDWSRISAFLFGVKRLPGSRPGGSGVLDVVRLQVRLPKGSARREDAREPAEEQWGYAVYFPKDGASVPGLRRADVRKAAEHLRLYRDRDVLVTGFADRREAGAERLAAERGRSLADLLAREEGVAAGRIHVAASPPAKPLQGERLEKAVIRFLDEKER